MNTPSTSYLRDTIRLVNGIEMSFIELASRLKNIRDIEMWKGEYESFDDFLIESKLSKSTASKLVSVYEKYVTQGGLDVQMLEGAPYSSLYEAIPLIERDGVQSVVAKVKLLTRSEIKQEIREEKDGDCLHHETITICANCKARVYELQQQ